MKLQITEDVSQWQTISKLIHWMNGENKEFYPFVIDIGANDGKRLSNSWTFIIENAWEGILVEPVSESYNKILANYEGRDYQPAVEQVAISDNNDAKVLWVGGEDNMLSSFVQKASNNGILCNCMTPKELFDKYDVENVGVLSVDTEGHDFAIIWSMKKNTEVRPQIIITETWPHLYYDNIQKHSILFDEGYIRVLHCGENEIFYRS